MNVEKIGIGRVLDHVGIGSCAVPCVLRRFQSNEQTHTNEIANHKEREEESRKEKRDEREKRRKRCSRPQKTISQKNCISFDWIFIPFSALLHNSSEQLFVCVFISLEIKWMHSHIAYAMTIISKARITMWPAQHTNT